MAELHGPQDVLGLAVDVVTAYVSNNSGRGSELGALISGVHSVLHGMTTSAPEAPRVASKPAVPVRRSVTDDYIVCLEDGLKFKSLRRHLRTQYKMTPEDYRLKWNLPIDYPMVAPTYAKARSDLAKAMGLGQRRRKREG